MTSARVPRRLSRSNAPPAAMSGRVRAARTVGPLTRGHLPPPGEPRAIHSDEGLTAGVALAQPGCELGLELTAAAGRDDALPHLARLDDEQRRHLVDLEPLREIGPAVDRDADQVEGVVVSPPLQHLCEISLGPPAPSGHGRVEQDQSWALGGLRRRRGGERRDGHVAVISTATWPETVR